MQEKYGEISSSWYLIFLFFFAGLGLFERKKETNIINNDPKKRKKTSKRTIQGAR